MWSDTLISADSWPYFSTIMWPSCNQKIMGAYSQKDRAWFVTACCSIKDSISQQCNVFDDLFLSLLRTTRNWYWEVMAMQTWGFAPHRPLWSFVFKHKWLIRGKICESEIWCIGQAGAATNLGSYIWKSISNHSLMSEGTYFEDYCHPAVDECCLLCLHPQNCKGLHWV
jgi:hypothetical protein